MVNTVSPTYAREVLGPEMGMGLESQLRARGARFTGILNGLDQALWNPATDGTLAAPYDAADRRGKAACRADLCARVGLDPDDPAPILGVIGRLDPQKGFDLVAGAAPALVAAGARIVALGSGDAGLVAGMRAIAAARPGSVAMVERFDRDLARRIYAGADLFLMPSRFEPCGQGQMIAMRYGTPPVARRTGGLADTIVDLHEEPGTGTGFLFDDATPDALRFACERAIAVLRDPDRTRWEGLVRRGMAVDWDWERAIGAGLRGDVPAGGGGAASGAGGSGASRQPAAVSQAAPAAARRRSARQHRRHHDRADRERRPVGRDLERGAGRLRGLPQQAAHGVGAPRERRRAGEPVLGVVTEPPLPRDVAAEAGPGDRGAPVRGAE